MDTLIIVLVIIILAIFIYFFYFGLLKAASKDPFSKVDSQEILCDLCGMKMAKLKPYGNKSNYICHSCGRHYLGDKYLDARKYFDECMNILVKEKIKCQ